MQGSYEVEKTKRTKFKENRREDQKRDRKRDKDFSRQRDAKRNQE